jgi:hypothetical protein
MRVALGSNISLEASTVSAKYDRSYFALSELNGHYAYPSRGDALRACPWLSYCAPSALGLLNALALGAEFGLLRQSLDQPTTG